MDEVSLDTLLLSSECDVQWSSRGTSKVHRTLELHNNDILYCFDEPRNSMAKHIREKIYVQGCRVVDGGAYGGTGERLLLFLANYDYAERVDLMGNHQAYVFAPQSQDADSTDRRATLLSHSSALPSANYVVQLFPTDKVKKWHLLQAIQRASQEYRQLYTDTGGASKLTMRSVEEERNARGGRSGESTSAVRLSLNGVEGVIGDDASVVPSRTQSGVSILSDHEVFQLSDVLREYEVLQGQKSDSTASPPQAEEVEKTDVKYIPHDDEPRAERAEGVVRKDDRAAALMFASAKPSSRLQQSPLFPSCIRDKPANQVCADCNAPYPSWCLLQPFGAFVCIECIGVHRRLWSNKCRGAELDLWSEADLAFMEEHGNDFVNDELEFHVAFPKGSVEYTLHPDPPVKPVSSYSALEVREAFIQWKYQEQLFTRGQHPAGVGPLPPRADPAGLDRLRCSVSVDAQRSEDCVGSEALSVPAQLLQPQPEQRSFFRDAGPPRYAGLLDVVVKELVGPEFIAGAVCVLTNGFQALCTQPSRRLLHMHRATVWDEHLQLGVEGSGQKPLYCTIYRGKGEVLAAAELWMQGDVFQPGASCMFASTLTWSQLHKEPCRRVCGEAWQVTFLTSYQLLA